MPSGNPQPPRGHKFMEERFAMAGDPRWQQPMTNTNPEGLATKVNRDQLVAELRRCAVEPSDWIPLLDRAADTIETQGRELERYREALMNKKWLAAEFHHQYEHLAAEYGYKTRPGSAVPWDYVPEPNRSLMLNVAQNVGAAVIRRVQSPTQAPLQEGEL